MDKMKMETTNKTLENLQKLKKMFPEVITESKDENGEIVAAIDAKKLEQLLSTKVIDGDESYDFTWVGKKRAMIEACKPIRKTLRPCREESVDWENTQNLYIEGDNLDVLKLLQESYLNKVKMIYIDPPYNTGNNLIYKNNFSTNELDYDVDSGIVDDNGNRLVVNSKFNGRFHSDWCSIIYSVLMIARSMLTQDGYISIAMDDNELFSLKMMTDEVFGEQNFIGTLVTRCNPQGRNKNNLDPVHEYHLLYAKDILSMPCFKIKKSKDYMDYRFLMRSGTNSRRFERPLRFYPILVKDGKISMISKDEYMNIYAKKSCFNEEYLEKLRIKYETLGYQFILPISKDGEEKVWQRTFDRVSEECSKYIYEKGQIKIPPEDTRTPTSLWSDDIYSNVQNGTNKLKELFDGKTMFDFSKSIFTVKDIVSLNTSSEDIVLDFFSGSATTAHAVMQLNAEDGGKRKFIMVQLPEVCDEKSEAYKAGYKNICEIGKERIRRAGKKIVEESGKKDLDIGFRVLKLDDGNMKDVYYTPEEYNQKDLADMASNIKDDRSPEDLLYACMLEWGLELSLPHKVQTVAGYNVHIVDDGALVACFDDKISEDAIKQIAELQPLRAVFRDSGFAGDAARVNVGEIFKLKSPKTTIKVL